MSDNFSACLQRTISSWHGVDLPSPAATRALVDLTETIRSLASVRDRLAFDDDAASFAAALRELAD